MKNIYLIGIALTAFLFFQRYVFIFPTVSLPWIIKDLFLGLLFAHLYLGAAYLLMVIPRAIFGKTGADSVLAFNWIVFSAVVFYGIVYFLQNVQTLDKSFMLIYGIPMIIIGGLLERAVFAYDEAHKESDSKDQPKAKDFYERDLIDGKDQILR